MDPIDAIVERRISEAMERGDFEQPAAFAGRPLPDLDSPRQPGWWLDDFVARERRRLREERSRTDD